MFEFVEGGAGVNGGGGSLNAIGQRFAAVGGEEGGGGIEQHDVTLGAGDFAGENVARDGGIVGGLAAGEVFGGAVVAEKRGGINVVGFDDAVFQLRAARCGGEGDFIHAVVAMHDEDAAGAEGFENFREGFGQLRGKNAEKLAGCAGGVGERPQQIEQGAHAELFAHRAGKTHGLVEGGGKHEGDADFVERLLHEFGRGVKIEAEAFEAVGAAALAGAGAVAMLGDGGASASGHKGDGGGDVEGDAAIAAGANGVEGVGGERLHAGGGGAHGTGRADDFRNGLAFGREGGEVGADLSFGELAGKHGGNGGKRFVVGEVLAGDEFFNECGDVHVLRGRGSGFRGQSSEVR